MNAEAAPEPPRMLPVGGAVQRFRTPKRSLRRIVRVFLFDVYHVCDSRDAVICDASRADRQRDTVRQGADWRRDDTQ